MLSSRLAVSADALNQDRDIVIAYTEGKARHRLEQLAEEDGLELVDVQGEWFYEATGYGIG